jgi:uncharacterized protein (TIGR00369 family)
VRIIIKCPESNSPLRGRIHLRGLSFRPTSNLLQFGGGPYIECKRLWLLKYLDYTHHGLRSALKPNGLFTSIMIKCMTHEKRVRQSFSKQAFMSTLGAELKAVVQGGVEIRLPFSPTLTQQNGYLHAGAITAVLDSACGYAALTVAADDKEVLTVEFKVNLLAPAAGEVFAARAQVKKAGRTLTVCAADAFAISDGREKVVATMLATIMAVPITPAK